MSDDGLREILTVDETDTQSETAYQGHFCSLKRRGLSDGELVVSDGYRGLEAAIARHFQGASCRGARSATGGISSRW